MRFATAYVRDAQKDSEKWNKTGERKNGTTQVYSERFGSDCQKKKKNKKREFFFWHIKDGDLDNSVGVFIVVSGDQIDSAQISNNKIVVSLHLLRCDDILILNSLWFVCRVTCSSIAIDIHSILI